VEEREFEYRRLGEGGGEAAVKVTQSITVNRRALSITLEYSGEADGEMVEGLSEVIREAAAGWFGGRDG